MFHRSQNVLSIRRKNSIILEAEIVLFGYCEVQRNTHELVVRQAREIMCIVMWKCVNWFFCNPRGSHELVI